MLIYMHKYIYKIYSKPLLMYFKVLGNGKSERGEGSLDK